MKGDRLQQISNWPSAEVEWFFFCPGCQMRHLIRTTGPHPCWEWNGDKINPTFTPSYLVRGMAGVTQCHSFIKAGSIQYLDDCGHGLKGQTVELPALDDEGNFKGEDSNANDNG